LRSLAMQSLDPAREVHQLERIWQQLEPADRRDPAVAVHAARRAVALGANEHARQWLRPFWEGLSELDADSREQVALAVADAAPGIASDWLPRIETAAEAWPQDAAVQAAAGLVLADRQLFGKARRPLEQSAASPRLPGPLRRRAWRVLAAIAREGGEADAARRCEQEAAALD